jgi:hypothetical protein
MNTLARDNPRSAGLALRRAPLRTGDFVRLAAGAALLAAAAFGAIFAITGSASDRKAPPALEGTWELSSLNGEPTGSEAWPAVVWQKVSFRGGTVRGETVVKMEKQAGGVRLPFPDESVDRVVATADGTGLRALWSGTYQVGARDQVILHIGKAIYFVKVSPTPNGETIGFNQDVILALPGAASYRRSLYHRPRAAHPIPSQPAGVSGPK